MSAPVVAIAPSLSVPPTEARNKPEGQRFWWKVPDDEDRLMSLRPAELKCYLVVARAIQRDRNRGRISERQISERAKLGLRHVHTALNSLAESGWLRREGKPGAIAEYFLPFAWSTGGNCTPTGEQFEQANCNPTGIQPVQSNRIPTGKQLEPARAPQGKQHRIPTGEQNCTPMGIQHLESSEFLEHTPGDCGGLAERIVGTEAKASALLESQAGPPRCLAPRRPLVDWPECGWEDSEDFEVWWTRMVEGHPNRSQNAAAKTKAVELVMAGQFKRADFERGYAVFAASHPRWSEERGRYVENLLTILVDKLWKFKPLSIPSASEIPHAEDYIRRLENE